MQASMPEAGGDDDLMEDDSGTEPEISDSDSSGEKEGEHVVAQGEENDDSEGEGFEFAEDADDILGSDVELPEEFMVGASGSEAESEWDGVGSEPGQKRKSNSAAEGEEKNGRRKKRKIKHLPTFASLEDYEKLIDEAPEDNI